MFSSLNFKLTSILWEDDESWNKMNVIIISFNYFVVNHSIPDHDKRCFIRLSINPFV